MKKCPDCFNGIRRDVVVGIDEDGNEITSDVECNRCDGLGNIPEGSYLRCKLGCRM